MRDFQIRFSMTQEPRVTPPGYNGNPSQLSDLRDTPILIVGGNDTYTVCTCIVKWTVWLLSGSYTTVHVHMIQFTTGLVFINNIIIDCFLVNCE